MIRAGRCQCGQVDYEIHGAEIGLVYCYCTECQKMSTGIATYSMVVAREAFRITAGRLKQWERTADSGTRTICHFCPECGVRIFHENPAMNHVRVKAGTLDDARQLEPDAHIWTRSAPSWVEIPEGSLVYETQGDPAEMIAAVQARRAAKAD